MKSGLSTASVIGILIVSTVFLAAIMAGVLMPHDPWERFEPLVPPGPQHWLGTNDMGYDILSELIVGSRVSLIVGFGAAFVASVLGLLLGLLAGYFRGPTDEFIMGLTDIVLMIPRIPLIIVLAAFLRPGYWWIALLIGALWWTSTTRVIRSKTLQVREMNYVLSARCLGFSDRHILITDILPNILLVVLPKFMLTVATAMISEASLSFLGLGDPGAKSWGGMLNFAFTKGGLINGIWWWLLPPGICITLTVVGVTLIGFTWEEKPGLEGQDP